MPLLSELLADFEAELHQPRVRYPVIRHGERVPIPSVVRFSVYRRDGFRCRECGAAGENGSGMELDHMLPWSAGGGDHSGNLRTLCARCNQERSNWYDAAHENRRCPTTWWCWDCWRHPGLDNPEPDYLDDVTPQRQFRPGWRNGVNLNFAPYVTEPRTQVYCAWCWGYSWSDVLFDETQQDALARAAHDPTTAKPAEDHNQTEVEGATE